MSNWGELKVRLLKMEIDSTDVKQTKTNLSVPGNELNDASEESEAGLATDLINNVEAFTQGSCFVLFCLCCNISKIIKV